MGNVIGIVNLIERYCTASAGGTGFYAKGCMTHPIHTGRH